MSESCPLATAVRRFTTGLPPGSVGVVAVSGGPDSVALLRALMMEDKNIPLLVAHLNHQLRGDESDADEAFVRELHGKLVATGALLGPLQCQRLDVRAAAHGDNLEAAARRLRYHWLTQLARETGAAWVATGHTADDQAETVLHRLLRGSGLRGLAAMPRQRHLAPGITLVRPLLDVRRSEVLVFLQQIGQAFCLDSSNLDRQYTRSRLRHDLLPLLAAQYNPATVAVLGRLAQQAGEAQVFIESHAAKLLSAAELPRAGAMVVLDTRLLASPPGLLVREAMRLLWQREDWPLGEMGFEKWQDIAEVVGGRQTAVDMPGGVHVRRVGHVVQVSCC